MWKKKIAVLMAAAMITGMSGMTVFAEEQQTGGAPQMEQQAPASQTVGGPQGWRTGRYGRTGSAG